MSTTSRVSLIDVALGYESADVVITNGNVVHVNTGAIRADDIAIKGDRIAAVGDVGGDGVGRGSGLGCRVIGGPLLSLGTGGPQDLRGRGARWRCGGVGAGVGGQFGVGAASGDRVSRQVPPGQPGATSDGHHDGQGESVALQQFPCAVARSGDRAAGAERRRANALHPE